MAKRSRLFTVTDYECDDDFWDNEFNNGKYDYIFRGKEICPKTNRPHFQMFVYFKNARNLSAVIKLLKPRHVEVARGTVDENFDYCEKDGDTREWGKRPNQGKRTDLDDIKGLIAEGLPEVEIANSDFPKWLQYRKGFEAYRALIECKRNWVPEVHVFYGEAESGKTRRVYEMAPNVAMISFSGDTMNPFIAGYNGEDDVLLDDFDQLQCKREFMLKLCDRYPMMINVKGGARNWKPKRIFITTNGDPREFYGGGESWNRRLSNVVQVLKQDSSGNVNRGPVDVSPRLAPVPRFQKNGTEVLPGNTVQEAVSKITARHTYKAP